jgi:CHAT domain-containing protein
MEQTELQSKLLWRSDSRRLYENAVEACYLQGNTDDALYFFEKSRAVLLNDQLNEQRWLAEPDILRQSQLKKQILAKEKEFNNVNKSSDRYSELEKEIFTQKQELESLQQQIKQKNPLYYQSFVDSNSVNFTMLKKSLLKDNQALIEILSGDSAVYVLAIMPQNSSLQKVNKHDFDSLSMAFISYVSDPVLLNKAFESFKNVSSQLYQLIFRDISLPTGRVIISLDNRYFPFEALVTNPHRLTYFLEDHAVSYTYSARYLMNSFTSNSGYGTNMFMGVAPVKFGSDMNLASLSGSDRSLLRMQQYFQNSTNLIGVNASRNNFLSLYYKYRIIQLYTHATDSGYDGEPMIYFSDSVLSLNDLIYQNRPATSLIVLAACQTASGKLYNGEGVFSFNRQFAAVGIPSSVANLWQADNESSYRITELLYKYLAKGLPIDVALQQAKKEFIKGAESKEHQLPFFWAAPVLVGQASSIPLHESSWQWFGLIVFLLLVAFLIERNVLSKSKPNRHW